LPLSRACLWTGVDAGSLLSTPIALDNCEIRQIDGGPQTIQQQGIFAAGSLFNADPQASSSEATSINFSRTGNDEMDEVSGDGSAELRPDGSLHGEICYHDGDEWSFIARKWTSSTAG